MLPVRAARPASCRGAPRVARGRGATRGVHEVSAERSGQGPRIDLLRLRRPHNRVVRATLRIRSSRPTKTPTGVARRYPGPSPDTPPGSAILPSIHLLRSHQRVDRLAE
jgi:hypothetical protein